MITSSKESGTAMTVFPASAGRPAARDSSIKRNLVQSLLSLSRRFFEGGMGALFTYIIYWRCIRLAFKGEHCVDGDRDVIKLQLSCTIHQFQISTGFLMPAGQHALD